jgi:hypothetical protein
MHTHSEKKTKDKSQAVANTISQKQQIGTPTFQFVDNRPEAQIQRKIHSDSQEIASEVIQEATPKTTELKATDTSISNSIQLAKKRKKKTIVKSKTKKKKKYDDDSDDEGEPYLPPNEQNKHRQTFGQGLRKTIIKNSSLKNKSGLHVCPGCGMPLADKKGKEIKTYYTSKKGNRHNIVSGQMDHFPPWAGRLKKLKSQKKSDEQIREDHDDPTRLRALCLRCNGSHKYEKTKDLPEDGYSDQEYYSDDEERDKEIWKKFRKDDDDKSGGSGGVTA